MKLTYASASPFVRKVRVLLLETGQQDDVELITVKTTPLTTPDEVFTANPIGKIPALIRPDGPAIYDSRVICRFLDARAGNPLYPQSSLWDVLTIEATADGIMEAAVLMRYEEALRPEEKRSAEWLEAQWDKIARALAVLNARWMSHLAGPLDMGQIAVGCALDYLDFRQADRNWPADNDSLAAWHTEFSKRDSMKATVPHD
ncbi:glutathione S-transferase [Pelagimonas sp. KU-00592-HH]|uniref:glutathione S-transferase n=1 Tax=Pelagimonas sp. KU-00592-HH TaxID=3127651 RepID=UPI00310AC8BC